MRRFMIRKYLKCRGIKTTQCEVWSQDMSGNSIKSLITRTVSRWRLFTFHDVYMRDRETQTVCGFFMLYFFWLYMITDQTLQLISHLVPFSWHSVVLAFLAFILDSCLFLMFEHTCQTHSLQPHFICHMYACKKKKLKRPSVGRRYR